MSAAVSEGAAGSIARTVSLKRDEDRQDDINNDVSVWDVVGTPPERFFIRFGGCADLTMFRLMRAVTNIDAVWVPVLLSFGQLRWLRPLVAHPLCHALDLTLNIFYTLGVLLQLRTSVVVLAVAQEWVNPADVIMLRISSARFCMDCISLIGALWWSPMFNTNIAIVRMLRIWRLSAGADDLYELHTAELTSEDALLNFLYLISKVLLFIHVFTCAWFYAATMSDESWERVLQEDPRLPSISLASVYLVYFSDGAAMLAGWGGPPSFSPDGLYSIPELQTWSILAPLSALCMAWIFAQLLEVVQQASASTDKHLDKLAELSAVLDSLFVPQDLKQRCLSYHSFMSIHNANKEEYDSLFSSLSVNLQLDIKVHLFDDLCRKAPFFCNLPEAIMTKLVLAFEEEVYGPGQYIFYKGEYGEELFFIMRGNVEVIVDNGTVVAVLGSGQFFGELALVLDQPRMASTRAKSFTMLAKITRELFEEVLNEDLAARQLVMDEITKRQTDSAEQTKLGDQLGDPQPHVGTPLLSDRGDEQIRPARPEEALPSRQSSSPPALPSRQSSRRSLSDSVHAEVNHHPNMMRKSAAGGAGIFNHHAKSGGVSSEDMHQLLADLARMAQIVHRFQGQFDSIDVRLRNMEVGVARAGS